MAAFKFKLDFLIELRQRKEEEAMTRLAKRLASIAELQKEIAKITENKQRLAAELEEKMRLNEITIPLLLLYKDYDRKLEGDLNKLNEFLFLSRREEAKERAILTKASIELKIMEKLKDKRKTEFVAEQMALEQNSLEEMSSLVKSRKDRLAKAEKETFESEYEQSSI